MSTSPILLALLGFNAFERRSFQTFFELGCGAGPGYEVTGDLWRAECAVADADDDEAMARLMHASLLERAVLLGSALHPGAALQLPRPINVSLVVRALDALVRSRPRAGTELASASGEAAPRLRQEPMPVDACATVSAASAPTPVPPITRPARSDNQVQRVLAELAFRTATLPSNLDARALAAEAAPGARRGAATLDRPDRLPSSRARARSEVLPMEHILVIDNDAETLRLIAIQLQRFGFQMHLAGHPDDAMRLLTHRFHDYVFVDPALPRLDALLVCRLAKKAVPPADRCVTTVVLLADPHAPAKMLERALPAADACLRKPLQQHALLQLMGKREVARYAYADTTRTTTLI